MLGAHFILLYLEPRQAYPCPNFRTPLQHLVFYADMAMGAVDSLRNLSGRVEPLDDLWIGCNASARAELVD